MTTEWTARAACAGKDWRLWFPKTATEGKPARRICASCPVKLECLTAALEEEMPKKDPESGKMEGIWVNKEGRDGIRGGLNHIERWGLSFPAQYRELKERQRQEAIAKAAKRAQEPDPPRRTRTDEQRRLRALADNYRKLEATG